MPYFQKADEPIRELAVEILCKFDTHKPLLDAKVKVDIVLAFCDRHEETGEPLNDALTKNGIKCLGICRKLPPKDRAMGRGDAEVALDGDWWQDANPEERAALLDHELHHIAVKLKKGVLQQDAQGRPQLFLRKHDVEVGWFGIIAARHGAASQERIQAARVMDAQGQLYWPEIHGKIAELPKKRSA